jgi:hypothetical protein
MPPVSSQASVRPCFSSSMTIPFRYAYKINQFLTQAAYGRHRGRVQPLCQLGEARRGGASE